MITIEIYKSEKFLKRGFETASGYLEKKIIFQLIFSIDQNRCFIYELPLSPSLGEMPQDIMNLLQRFRENAFSQSRHLRRAISYLQAMVLQDISFQKIKPISTYRIFTYGIGTWPKHNITSVARLKCNSKIIKQLIEYSWSTNTAWSVDFNGSLDEATWKIFTKESQLKHCLWIEQPLKPLQFSHKLAAFSTVPIYADEEMSFLSTDTFKSTPFNGFILKPIRHDFTQTMNWLSFAHLEGIPSMIGSPVCDFVSCAFCDFFNQFSTIQVMKDTKSHFFFGPQFDGKVFFYDENKIIFNSEVFEFIARNYTLIETLNLPIL